MSIRLSTKRGDEGLTDTLSRKRISKTDPEIEFLGTVDELQAFIGICEMNVFNRRRIQKELYEIMSGNIVDDWFDTDLEHNGEFALPTGWLNVARTVCRRAERRAVAAGRTDAVPYLNRLSDYLYKLSYGK